MEVKGKFFEEEGSSNCQLIERCLEVKKDGR